MAQAQTSGTHNTRRAPVAHSEAVQEAKRREKMQTHSSSHRTAGTKHEEEPAAEHRAS